jgi:hypothetical protein
MGAVAVPGRLNLNRPSADNDPGGSYTMASDETSVRAKAGFGAACTVCCALPMFVVTGVVSLAAVTAIGAAVGSIVAVVLVTWAFSVGRLPALGRWRRAIIATVGVIASAVGLTKIDASPDSGRALVVIGVALLTTTAMLALTRVRSDQGRPPPARC